MTETTRFATLLKRYRQAAGLSQEALATRAQLSARAISDLERGINRTPRNDTLELLTEALTVLTSTCQTLGCRTAGDSCFRCRPFFVSAPCSPYLAGWA